MKRLCYALDLVDDVSLIAEYESAHEKIWPEVADSLRNAGVEDMEIYRVATRLFMIMDTTDDYDPETRNEADEADPRVQEWEELMGKYQQSLAFAAPGEKWVLMNCIFSLSSQA